MACGYSDSLLLNFSFGDGDAESQLAEAMADHLGLPFERIHNDGNSTRVLARPGRIYPEPFGDHSAVPTAQLAHGVVDRLAGEARLILDGTGADGVFGMSRKIRKWQQISSLPRFAGSAASGGYAAARLWLHEGRLEYSMRVLRRMALLPDVAGIVAQNPLAGLLYDDRGVAEVSSMLVDWIDAWAGDSFERQAVGADMALTCANVFVAKSKPIFTEAGLNVLYPFLAPDILALVLHLAGASEATAKSHLKHSLAAKFPMQWSIDRRAVSWTPLVQYFGTQRS